MPTDFVSWMFLIGRVLMGGAFLIAGIRNLRSLPRLTGLMEGRKFPMPAQATLFGVLVQTICGALVMIGIFTPWAALGLAAFLAAATLIVHPYWTFSKGDQGPHINACTVNSALVGAFLLLASVTF
jgi:putative oxidoreductase